MTREEGIYAHAVRVVPCSYCGKPKTVWCVTTLGNKTADIHTARLRDARAFDEGNYKHPEVVEASRRTAVAKRVVVKRGRQTGNIRRSRVKNIGNSNN